MNIDDLNKAGQHPLVQSGERVVMYDKAGRIQIAPVKEIHDWEDRGYTVYNPGPAPEALPPVVLPVVDEVEKVEEVEAEQEEVKTPAKRGPKAKA